MTDGGKTITRVRDSSAAPAEPASVVAIAKAARNNFFTGVRTASGSLKIVA